MDLQKAKKSEELVKDIFETLSNEYIFENVSDIPKYYYRGDIKATRVSDGKEIFIEVKNDSRICDTYNVLCEDEVYFKEDDYYGRSNMSCGCDIYVVVSEQARRIYVLDFKALKACYRRGEFKIINHPTQITYCFMCNISQIKKWGAFIT